MGAVVVDSSFVIAVVQDRDVHHRPTVAELRAARARSDLFVLPATVLAESLVAARRAGPSVAEGMHRDLVEFFGPVRPVDETVAVVSADLRGRFPWLRLPDALVIATGVVDDAAVLTCDRRLHDVDPRVQVVGSD